MKPTVRDTMRKLTTPVPAPVTIVNNRLLTGGEILRYWLSVGILLQLRTLTVWGFLAVFFPALGVTWFMVMFALYAIRHVIPVKPQLLIDQIAAQRK